MKRLVPVALILRWQLMHLARFWFANRPSFSRLVTITSWPFWQVVSVKSIYSTDAHCLAIARLSLMEERRVLSLGKVSDLVMSGLSTLRSLDSSAPAACVVFARRNFLLSSSLLDIMSASQRKRRLSLLQMWPETLSLNLSFSYILYRSREHVLHYLILLAHCSSR